jgi:parallel beta-helix repeat protein
MTRLSLLLWALLLAIVGPGGASGVPATAQEDMRLQEPYVLKPTCDDSLQAVLDLAVPGGTVQARTDCVYREEVTIRGPIILDGQGLAEIRGSDVWTTWVPVGDLWVSANPVPFFETEGFCEEESDGRCLWPEQVFRDGVQLRQVASGNVPEPGQFSLNVGRQVVVADDPSDSVMEVTTRTRWVTVDASDVTVQGMTMKHAATDAQHGAIRIDDVSNWTLRDNVLSDAHAANVYFRNTDNGQMLDNEIFNGGQLGFAGRGTNLVFRGNSVHHNNTEEFSAQWEAGGAKLTEAVGVEIDGNEFFLNNGPGVWCDIDCSDVTISNNNVYHNHQVGIYFEISDGAEISGNSVWANRLGPDAVGWAGIFISSSSNAKVHDNVVAWNGDGIVVMSQCRSTLADGSTCDTSHRWNNVSGNEVFRNSIIMAPHDDADPTVYALGWQRDITDESGVAYQFMFTDDAANRGYENVYWIDQGDRSGEIGFSWGGTTFAALDQFLATPGGESGRYLDARERDRILEEAGIPVEPEYPDGIVTPLGT